MHCTSIIVLCSDCFLLAHCMLAWLLIESKLACCWLTAWYWLILLFTVGWHIAYLLQIVSKLFHARGLLLAHCMLACLLVDSMLACCWLTAWYWLILLFTVGWHIAYLLQIVSKLFHCSVCCLLTACLLTCWLTQYGWAADSLHGTD